MVDEDDARELRRELEVDPGSFLALALQGHWSGDRLGRLARLLRQACLDTAGSATLERWLAAGFHELDTNLDHYLPTGCRADEETIDDLKEHLMFLAAWFFSGVEPMAVAGLEAELQQILARGPGLRPLPGDAVS